MPAVDQTAISIWASRFRRIYAGKVAQLAALSDEVAADAAEVVTITSTNLEGQGASGQLTGNKLEILAAIERLLADSSFNPDIVAPVVARSRVIIPDFRLCSP